MIPFLDLNAQYLTIREEVEPAILNVISSSQFVLGKEVDAFEREFAEYCGGAYSIGVNSGTSALHLALLAAGVGPGDEVITVPFTFVATVAAIRYTGALPVFADIDPKSFTLDPAQLERAITPRTKAVIPVHLYGHPADMDPIMEIANRHGLVVIEDAAQAHGAKYKGRRVGGIGQMACFSFYPGKNLGAYGEAGAVVTSDPAYNSKIRMLRDWGQQKKYMHEIQGYNYRMEGIQGAVLRVKLRRLEGWNAARRRHAGHYTASLSTCGWRTPEVSKSVEHVFHVYAIRSAGRAELQAQLHAEGIQTNIHYPIPIHLLPAHADLGYKAGEFPHSESAANEVLSLPMYPELSSDQVQTVAQALTAVPAGV